MKDVLDVLDVLHVLDVSDVLPLTLRGAVAPHTDRTSAYNLGNQKRAVGSRPTQCGICRTWSKSEIRNPKSETKKKKKKNFFAISL